LEWRVGRIRSKKQTSVTTFPGCITYLYMFKLNTIT
jgi:hypothetical protein